MYVVKPTTNVLGIIAYRGSMFVMESCNALVEWRRMRHTVLHPHVPIAFIVGTLLYVSTYPVFVMKKDWLNAQMVMMNIFVTLNFLSAQVIAFVSYFPFFVNMRHLLWSDIHLHLNFCAIGLFCFCTHDERKSQ